MYIFVFRLSVFGDFKQFVPTTASVIAWTQTLKQAGFDLLPNIIRFPQFANIPFAVIPSGATANPIDNRIQFSSEKGDITIRLLAERVDVEFTQGTADIPEKYFIDKLDVACTLMKTMLHALGDVRGTRLAYYADVLLPEPSGQSFQNFYNGNNLNISIEGSSEDCIEWSHKFNKRFVATIGQKNEMSNAILLIESGMIQTNNIETDEQQSVKGLHILSDINTLAEHAEERFEIIDLINFAKRAQSVFLEFLKQIKEKLLE